MIRITDLLILKEVLVEATGSQPSPLHPGGKGTSQQRSGLEEELLAAGNKRSSGRDASAVRLEVSGVKSDGTSEDQT
ncbi:MAG: hypothetical protein ACE15E_17625 [Acidobacteriota bacterium]